MRFMRLAASGGKAYISTFTEYTTPGATSVSVPGPDANGNRPINLTIESVGGGCAGSVANAGGGGAAYAKTNAFAIGAIATYYVFVGSGGGASQGLGTASYVKETDINGTTKCAAAASLANWYDGALTTTCVGDTKYGGGNSLAYSAAQAAAGGGAGGPSGAGSDSTRDANNSYGGISGGAPGGNGGNGHTGAGVPSVGSNYGGGGGSSADNFANGAGGYIKLTWT